MKPVPLLKPLLRGHFHQAAFFTALGACAMLIAKSRGSVAIYCTTIYSITLIALFGISALYHRPQWSEQNRLWLKRLDHCAIFLIIAGTCLPVSLLGIGVDAGWKLLNIVLMACGLGILQSIFWVKAPKWFTALLYVGISWIILPFSSQLFAAIGSANTYLLFGGGVIYTAGAAVYALKYPNFSPRVFGYHEVFHLLVVIAALCHFILVYKLVSLSF